MNSDLRPASRFANEAVNPAAPRQQRECFAVYLERFAWFFSRGFFVRKCFEVLNSEQKPEHAGVRAALEVLFAEYRRCPGSGVSEDVTSYVEHCYTDDMYMELNVDRTAHFFAWLGVVHPPSHVETSAEVLGVCPRAADGGQPMHGHRRIEHIGAEDDELQSAMAASLASYQQEGELRRALALSRQEVSNRSLAEQVVIFTRDLGLAGEPAAVVSQACDLLGVPKDGLTLKEQADRCDQIIFGIAGRAMVPGEAWPCGACTFINDSARMSCEICTTQRIVTAVDIA